MFDTTETLDWAPSPVSPGDLIDELAATRRRIDQLEAHATDLLAEIDEVKAYQRDGYTSPTALLKHRCAIAGNRAQRMVIRARALLHMPITAALFRRGVLSPEQVDVLCDARFVAPDEFRRDESKLCAWARSIPLVAELRKRLEYWKHEVALDDVEQIADFILSGRAINLGRRLFGMTRVTGWLNEEDGELFAAALETGPPHADDERTPTQRRADRLMEIVAGGSYSSHLVVHVDAGTAAGDGPGKAETSRGSVLTPDAIRRISCDCAVSRVVFGPDSQPLDVGRAMRLVPAPMRRALDARDGGCVSTGCDRPAHWCDAHHVIHWADWGLTCLDNLVLLCRHHHRLVHEAQWTISGPATAPVFHRPDGTRLEDPARAP